MKNYSNDELAFLTGVRKTSDEFLKNTNSELVKKYITLVNTDILGEIEYYIDFYIWKNYRTYAYSNYDDIKNEVVVEILTNLSKYNGKGSFLTFITPYIKAGITREICFRANRTLQQNRNILKINKTREALLEIGYKESEITVELLSQYTNLSVKVIKNSFNFQTPINLDNLDVFIG